MPDSHDDSALRPYPLPVSQHRNPPTMDQSGLLFESKHVSSLHLIDELDGTTRSITVSVETAAVDTSTGAKQFTASAAQLISVNGMPPTVKALLGGQVTATATGQLVMDSTCTTATGPLEVVVSCPRPRITLLVSNIGVQEQGQQRLRGCPADEPA